MRFSVKPRLVSVNELLCVIAALQGMSAQRFQPEPGAGATVAAVLFVLLPDVPRGRRRAAGQCDIALLWEEAVEPRPVAGKRRGGFSGAVLSPPCSAGLAEWSGRLSGRFDGNHGDT